MEINKKQRKGEVTAQRFVICCGGRPTWPHNNMQNKESGAQTTEDRTQGTNWQNCYYRQSAKRLSRGSSNRWGGSKYLSNTTKEPNSIHSNYISDNSLPKRWANAIQLSRSTSSCWGGGRRGSCCVRRLLNNGMESKNTEKTQRQTENTTETSKAKFLTISKTNKPE